MSIFKSMIRYITEEGEILESDNYILREIPVEPFYEVVNVKTGRPLEWRLDGKGYATVLPTFTGKSGCSSLHRLVLSTFAHEGYFSKAQVNHIDENKLDNKLSNLEWLSGKDNANHGTRNHRIASHMEGVHINRKDQSKPVLQFTKDGKFMAEYPSVAEARRQTGVIAIGRCCNDISKSAGGFVWRWKEAE